MNALRTQVLRFGAVGATNTAVTLGAYAAAVRLTVPYLPAGALAYALGALNGFALNRAWTFGRAGRPGRYLAVVALGIAADLALLRAASALGLPHRIAQVAVLAPVTLLTFALSRAWAFAEDVPRPPSHLHARRRAARRGRGARRGAADGRAAAGQRG